MKKKYYLFFYVFACGTGQITNLITHDFREMALTIGQKKVLMVLYFGRRTFIVKQVMHLALVRIKKSILP
jgi:hypothetical protein